MALVNKHGDQLAQRTYELRQFGVSSDIAIAAIHVFTRDDVTFWQRGVGSRSVSRQDAATLVRGFRMVAEGDPAHAVVRY